MTSGVPPRNIFIARRASEACRFLLARMLLVSVSHSPPGCAARLSVGGSVGAQRFEFFQRVGELNLDIGIASNDFGQSRFFLAMP